MLAIERRSEILTILEEEKRVLVAELGKKYNVTEETIRRDLDKLEKEGLIKKTYGGAVLVENISVEPSYKIREKINMAQKQTIAKKLALFIEPGDKIMMDSSSTSVLIARALRTIKNLTIITNSVEILMEYADCNETEIISTGGELRASSLSLVGHNAEQVIRKFTVDKSIISCKGVDFKKGITESNLSEMQMKRAMVESAKQSILAADASKFGKLSFTKLLDFHEISAVVTEVSLSNQWQSFLLKNNIKII